MASPMGPSTAMTDTQHPKTDMTPGSPGISTNRPELGDRGSVVPSLNMSRANSFRQQWEIFSETRQVRIQRRTTLSQPGGYQHLESSQFQHLESSQFQRVESSQFQRVESSQFQSGLAADPISGQPPVDARRAHLELKEFHFQLGQEIHRREHQQYTTQHPPAQAMLPASGPHPIPQDPTHPYVPYSMGTAPSADGLNNSARDAEAANPSLGVQPVHPMAFGTPPSSTMTDSTAGSNTSSNAATGDGMTTGEMAMSRTSTWLATVQNDVRTRLQTARTFASPETNPSFTSDRTPDLIGGSTTYANMTANPGFTGNPVAQSNPHAGVRSMLEPGTNPVDQLSIPANTMPDPMRGDVMGDQPMTSAAEVTWNSGLNVNPVAHVDPQESMTTMDELAADPVALRNVSASMDAESESGVTQSTTPTPVGSDPGLNIDPLAVPSVYDNVMSNHNFNTGTAMQLDAPVHAGLNFGDSTAQEVPFDVSTNMSSQPDAMVQSNLGQAPSMHATDSAAEYKALVDLLMTRYSNDDLSGALRRVTRAAAAQARINRLASGTRPRAADHVGNLHQPQHVLATAHTLPPPLPRPQSQPARARPDMRSDQVRSTRQQTRAARRLRARVRAESQSSVPSSPDSV